MGTLENEAIKYAEEDYLKGVARVERTPNSEIISAFPDFLKTKLKYAFIAGAYYRDALLAEGRKFDRKDGWEPKESPCPCEDGVDSKACAGCPQDELRKQTFRPYAETAEMIYDFTKRFPAVYPRSSVCEPMIWLKKKNSVNDGRKLVVCFTNSWVLLIDSKKLFMNELLEEYTYLDGSPVGMEC